MKRVLQQLLTPFPLFPFIPLSPPLNGVRLEVKKKMVSIFSPDILHLLDHTTHTLKTHHLTTHYRSRLTYISFRMEVRRSGQLRCMYASKFNLNQVRE